MWRNWNPVRCWWGCELVQPLWKAVWQFPKHLNTELSYDPEIPLLGAYPEELRTGIQTDICTPMVKAALFTIAKRFPQPKSGVQRQIDKMWSIHTMEYYAALKRKEVSDTSCSMAEP